MFNSKDYKESPFSIFSIDDVDAEIKSLKFSPNGQYLMLGTTNNTIAIIEPFDGKLLCKITEPINELGTSQILEAGFSPESRYLVSGSEYPKQKIFICNIEALLKNSQGG